MDINRKPQCHWLHRFPHLFGAEVASKQNAIDDDEAYRHVKETETVQRNMIRLVQSFKLEGAVSMGKVRFKVQKSAYRP